VIRLVVVAVLAVVVALAVGRFALLPLIAPDAAASADIEHLLPEAKKQLAGELDQPFAYLRYLGAETRNADELLILQFELRPVPYFNGEGAYLISRCTPLDEIDPQSMGGGRGVEDFATDSELAYLRSSAQPRCP
jgi:hypothetical protein